MMELIEILKDHGLFIKASGEVEHIKPTSFTTNSKQVTEGAFFICKGFTFKREYLEMAKEQGAVLYMADTDYGVELPHILVSDIRKATSLAASLFYDHPSEKMYVTGITGTKGKTTTAYILKSILDTNEPHKTALFSTVEINTGTESRVSHLTTPEPAELQAYFKEAVDNGCDRVVMEISSQAMKLSRVYADHFPIGMFLNVDEDHVGGNEHATLEEYVSCKISFLAQCDTVIVNRHTRFFDQVMEGCKGKKVILYGHDEDCDARILNIRADASGSRFDLLYEGKTYEFASSLVGRFNVENLTAAIIAALLMGIPEETIKSGIRTIYIPGRMVVKEYRGMHVIIDYAHNYLSFLNVYKAVNETFSPKRIFSLFGCPGERSPLRKQGMAELAEEYADKVYLTMDDPGYEDVITLCEDMKQYITKPCEIIPDREEAIYRALDEARPGDVVILGGKGAEKTQRIRDGYVPYISDGEAVEQWIKRQEKKD